MSMLRRIALPGHTGNASTVAQVGKSLLASQLSGCTVSQDCRTCSTGAVVAPQATASDPADVVLRKAFAHCVRTTRESDYQDYIWAAQLRKDWRPAVFALRAFHVEIASIADHVKEVMMVPMRMQWWRDAVNSLYKGKPIRHPVIQCLAQVNEAHPLTRYNLQKIISTRESDLVAAEPPATLIDLEKYALGTQYRLLRLQLEGVGVGGDLSSEVDVMMRDVGIAVGVAALLQGTAHHAQRRRLYLPADLCQSENLDTDEVFAGRSSQALQAVTAHVAVRAQDALEGARAAHGQMSSSLDPPIGPLMLSTVAAGLYLKALARAEYDPFAPQLGNGFSSGSNPLRHQLAVKW
eukprot:CAMPEP_0206142688 /NCGR_PEP_ID=MMETSP1473-20131121/17905_1 /ASSEMBLY_ACC=CAM_ASM_001109 /TAXON_ID=1461547 /ORGANISM="Stichococcus sp, Strain RCC1054" /LENGTH=349 /DNA_ID=CAMNT_0053537787 /DNA_START=155 /DNA_END=1201 /DNA_ORIENTATION=+